MRTATVMLMTQAREDHFPPLLPRFMPSRSSRDIADKHTSALVRFMLQTVGACSGTESEKLVNYFTGSIDDRFSAILISADIMHYYSCRW